jgi:hypothetical protein
MKKETVSAANTLLKEIKTLEDKIVDTNKKLGELVNKRDYLLTLKGDTTIIGELKKNTKLNNTIPRMMGKIHYVSQ